MGVEGIVFGALGGGALVTLILGLYRIMANDRRGDAADARWERLIKAFESQNAGITQELAACRESEGRLTQRIEGLEGEVEALRDRLHRAGWELDI